MKHRLPGILALLSLVPAIVLLCGYIARFGYAIHSTGVSGAGPISRQIDFVVDGGRVEIWTVKATVPPPTTTRTWHILWRRLGFRFRPPDLRRSLWEFDWHALAGQKSGQLFLLAFPIWCPLLPCLIAPALWGRNHRRRARAEQRGFPLDAVALTAPSPA